MHGPGKQVRAAIVQAFNLTKLSGLDVSQFARFVTNRTISGTHYDDRHFNSYSRTCRVCDVTYDYVIRTETMQEDLKPLLRDLKFSNEYTNSLKLSDNTRPSQQSNPDLSELQKLDPSLLSALQNRYALDFHLFGYHPNDIALCGHNSDWHCC